MVFMIFLGVQADLGLNDGSAACKESDARYGGIIILTLKDGSEDSVRVEQAVDSQQMVAVVEVVMGSRKWEERNRKENLRTGGGRQQRRERRMK